MPYNWVSYLCAYVLLNEFEHHLNSLLIDIRTLVTIFFMAPAGWFAGGKIFWQPKSVFRSQSRSRSRKHRSRYFLGQRSRSRSGAAILRHRLWLRLHFRLRLLFLKLQLWQEKVLNLQGKNSIGVKLPLSSQDRGETRGIQMYIFIYIYILYVMLCYNCSCYVINTTVVFANQHGIYS